MNIGSREVKQVERPDSVNAPSRYSARQTALIKGYFDLRQHSILKTETSPYEYKDWHAIGKSMVRYGDDGGRLIVYQAEDDLKVEIVYADGTFKSFAQPTVTAPESQTPRDPNGC